MGRLFAVGALAGLGVTAWHYVLAPLPEAPLESNQVAAIAEFMENNKKFWDRDAWTFADVPSHLGRLVEYPRDTDGPAFCVTRNAHRYNGVPLLRATAFFPNVTVAEVSQRMIEPAERLRWDKNYRFFEEFVTLPTPKAVREMREGFSVVSRQWCGHVIASAWLEKFGVKPRSFIYERLIARRDDGAVCLTYRSLKGDEEDKVTAKTSNPSTLAAAALLEVPEKEPKLGEKPPLFAATLRDKFLKGPAAETQEVTMLWQEVLLLPVRRRDIEVLTYEGRRDMQGNSDLPTPTGVTSRLFAIAYEFFHEGNPFESHLDRVLYDPESQRPSRYDPKRYEEVGTLMVMTSCNDGKVRPMPRVVEKYASKALTTRTYEWLLADIANTRKIEASLGPDAKKKLRK